jgi:hypothetical protein
MIESGGDVEMICIASSLLIGSALAFPATRFNFRRVHRREEFRGVIPALKFGRVAVPLRRF